MPDVSFSSLAVVLAVAFFSRLLLGLVPRFRVPGVVIEIILGIIIGPSVLGWAKADEPVQILALVGLAFLLFLSGLEIELDQLRGRLLARGRPRPRCVRGARPAGRLRAGCHGAHLQPATRRRHAGRHLPRAGHPRVEGGWVQHDPLRSTRHRRRNAG